MSSRLTPDDARALGFEILRGKPDPAAQVRLLRDVLRVPSDDERLRAARAALDDSAHVVRLTSTQHPDGSWGRLHARESSAKPAVPTTEWAVERALALGLDRRHPMLSRAAVHLAAIVEGKSHPPDPAERHDRAEVGLRLFAAAALARVDAEHPALDPVWNLWHEIARRALAGGRYDAAAEAAAHQELTGAAVVGSTLILSNRHALALLAARAGRIDPETRRALVLWVRQKEDGIEPWAVPLAVPPPEATAGALERFLQSHELLARLGVAGAATGPLADWLSRHRRTDGLWDLGSRAAWTAQLPLSESWRVRDARATDWTARVLGLLVRWSG